MLPLSKTTSIACFEEYPPKSGILRRKFRYQVEAKAFGPVPGPQNAKKSMKKVKNAGLGPSGHFTTLGN